jgi:XTP/dITP diphosphohydrolase
LREIVLATRSEGKLRELRSLFATYEIAAVDLRDAGIPESPLEESLETHATFEENALAKARHFHRVSGRPTVADDSGLVVAALDGRPGVLSKRWSGRTNLSGQTLDDENNRLLVRSLENAQDRRASYVCAAAFVDDEREFVCRGEVHGRILEAPRGNGGFGYDPYFFSTELGRTFAEVSGAEKARVSHRGRAFRALVERLGIGG